MFPLFNCPLINVSHVVPFNKRKTFSDRSFGTIGPRLWKRLPFEIRQAKSLDSFKSKLKTYLFRDL